MSEPRLETPNRIHLVIDFWDFEASCKGFVRDFRIDWRKVPEVFVKHAHSILYGNDNIQYGVYSGTEVHLSYGPNDVKLKDWAENVLSRFPGYSIHSSDRIMTPHITCNACKNILCICPKCTATIPNHYENNVAAQLATDMIAKGWSDLYDTVVLVSSDQRLAPAAELLVGQGKKVIQAGIQPRGETLAKSCWSHFDIRPMIKQIQRE